MKMFRNRTNRKKRLFTLVELVAAMAVMIFVALIIGSASAAFYNAWKRSVRITDRLKIRQNIDRIMDSCVRNMIPFSWKDEDDKEQVVFEGDKEEIFFTARRRAADGENSAYLFIRLRVNENRQLVAEYHTLPRFPWIEEGKFEMDREVLAENVMSITFLYASLEDGEVVWNEDWEEYDPETAQDDTTDILLIPLAIQMTVEWQDGSTEVWLRRTAASSRYSRFGGGSGLPRSEAAAGGSGGGNANRNRSNAGSGSNNRPGGGGNAARAEGGSGSRSGGGNVRSGTGGTTGNGGNAARGGRGNGGGGSRR